MEETMDKKIEVIMKRTNLSEEEARKLLEKYDGDVIEVLIHCEREKQKHKNSNGFYEKMNESELVTYIKELIKSGNVSRIIIRKDDTVLVNIPVNAGIIVGIALLLQPVLLVIGAATAVFTNLEIDIIKEDGSVEVVNKIIKNSAINGAKVATDVGSEIKGIFTNTCDMIKDKMAHIKRRK